MKEKTTHIYIYIYIYVCKYSLRCGEIFLACKGQPLIRRKWADVERHGHTQNRSSVLEQKREAKERWWNPTVDGRRHRFSRAYAPLSSPVPHVVFAAQSVAIFSTRRSIRCWYTGIGGIAHQCLHVYGDVSVNRHGPFTVNNFCTIINGKFHTDFFSVG